ncbi:MAG: OmpH family outer membrane protein [Gemmatimonadota bacterium]|jgi:outer membrane protein
MCFARSISVALAALMLGTVGTAAAQDGPPTGTTVVYLDSQEILQAAPGSAEAQRTFDRELTEWRRELEVDAATLDSLVRDYQRQEVMLSPQAKEQKQTELRSRQQELATKRGELETRARQRQGELLQPILDRVRGVIEQVRAERNYSMVFDVQTDGVIAADPALDVTDLVVRRLGGTPVAPGGTP